MQTQYDTPQAPASTPVLRPCIQCGGTVRNYRGQCVACKRASDRAYGKANREKINAVRNEWRKGNERDKALARAWVEKNRESVRAAAAKWRELHPETAREKSAVWKAQNPEKARASGAAWRAANAEWVKAKNERWRKLNLTKTRVYCQNRRARMRENGGELSKDIFATLFKLQRGKCACCGLSLGKNPHLDHIMPIALGGPNIDSNMQLLRQRCNNQKHAQHPVDFMQSRGLLL